MKCKFQFLVLIFSLTLFSCTSLIKPKDCEELEKIEVFSVGYPNLTFAIRQSESDVRKNQQKVISDGTKLRRIEYLIKKLGKCEDKDKRLGSIMGVCDFYCKDGKKYTLLYDSFFTTINNSFYCNDTILIKELFSK